MTTLESPQAFMKLVDAVRLRAIERASKTMSEHELVLLVTILTEFQGMLQDVINAIERDQRAEDPRT